MEISRVENVKKIYKLYGEEVCALQGVSFSVRKGEFVAIVGASGSGKSTLLHIIGGVDRPTTGRVYVNGTDIYAGSEKELAQYRRRQVGIIYQFYNLIPVLNARENITLPLELDGKQPESRKLEELLNLLGLVERRYHYPHQLSGGEQQRVAIARALIASPALVLADEPTGNLDSKNAMQIMDMLKKSNKKYGQTLIVITHDPRVAEMADRILELRDGEIVGDRTAST